MVTPILTKHNPKRFLSLSVLSNVIVTSLRALNKYLPRTNLREGECNCLRLSEDREGRHRVQRSWWLGKVVLEAHLVLVDLCSHQ